MIGTIFADQTKHSFRDRCNKGLPMSKDPTSQTAGLASTADIRAIAGNLNESDLLEITALRPTVRDVEEAAIWLSGDRDVFGTGEPLKALPLRSSRFSRRTRKTTRRVEISGMCRPFNGGPCGQSLRGPS